MNFREFKIKNQPIMKKNLFSKQFYLLGIVISILFSSCATKNVLTKASKKGVLMEYNFTDNYLNYKQNQKIDQTIEAEGQQIKINIVTNVDFLTKKNAMEGENIKIDVKLNSAEMGIEAMGQNMDPDLTDLDGKEFHMVLSKQGEEVDTHEADAIVFQTSPDERSNLGMIFNSLFPDLPGKTVKINDTWTSRDSIHFKDGERFTILDINNTHTLNNFINIDGVNCAEIKSSYQGTMKGKSFTQGMELKVDGTIEGEGVWYFDFENGILIKDNSTGVADGKISMSMAEMPLKRVFNNSTELVK